MPAKPFAIGIFVSTPSVDQTIRKIMADEKHAIRIDHHCLEDAVPAGKEMEEHGIEVIISRAGTAYLLRESLRVPVLSFPQTSLDLLVGIKEAKKKGRKIFLPSFRVRRTGVQMVGELLNIELEQAIYSDAGSLRRIISQAAKDGFEVIIGGKATMRFAEEFDIEFCELISSEEEILETIENAKSVAQSQREQRAASQRLQTIMDTASDGIVAVDLMGRITTINRTAERMLNISPDSAIGKSILHFLPESSLNRVLLTKRPIRDKVENVKGEMLVFSHTPVMLGNEMIGVVSSFKEVSHVMRAENTVRRTLAKGFVARYVIDDLIHQHPSMMQVADLSRNVAKTDSCVLITGETGTGKEIIAQSIHNLSRRKAKPFVSLHCAALPEQLLESELFGHEEGAFTGSKKGGKLGLFELAHQGTIFLDEIDSTPLAVQLRLLRVLQEKEVMRIGAEQTIPIDVRVIAASGQDLWKAVQDGCFRKDLFFRLNVLRVSIPPLQTRKEDIPKLLHHFMGHYSRKYSISLPALPQSYVDKLMDYSWPGNVRQLKHFCEQLLLNCSFRYGTDGFDALLDELTRIEETEERPRKESAMNQPFAAPLNPSRPDTDADSIARALEQARFNKTKAAAILGIGRTTLWRKIKALGLE